MEFVITSSPFVRRKIIGHCLHHAGSNRRIGEKIFHFLGKLVEIVLPLHPTKKGHETREHLRSLQLGKNIRDGGAKALGLGVGSLTATALDRLGFLRLLEKVRGVIEFQTGLGRILATGSDFPALVSADHIIQRRIHRIRHHIGSGGLETGDRGPHKERPLAKREYRRPQARIPSIEDQHRIGGEEDQVHRAREHVGAVAGEDQYR